MSRQCGMKMRARRLKPIILIPSMMKVYLDTYVRRGTGKPYENTLTIA